MLQHYATADRDAWQDRLMTLENASSSQLARWHGFLLASDLIEQQTGVTPRLASGACPACYRATATGRKIARELDNSN